MQGHEYSNRLAVSFGNTEQVVTSTDLAKLAASGESKMVEFKKPTGTRNEATRALSAMLNGAGGTVLLGIGDDGLVTGQDVTEKCLEDVTQACKPIRQEFPPKTVARGCRQQRHSANNHTMPSRPAESATAGTRGPAGVEGIEEQP